MENANKTLRSRLISLQDLNYRDFQCKLMPTVDPSTVIGVRTPELRKLAKEWSKTAEASAFLESLPHLYYEENNLHGLLIEQCGDYRACIAALDAFLPYVNNWATCDLMSPNIFKKHLPALLEKIKEWLRADHPYTVRFGIKMLMRFFLEEQFQPAYPEIVAGVHTQEYYVNMMIAWYFATALAKQYHTALPFIEQHQLDPWTHNKAIQKAIESYRISDEKKAYLKTLKYQSPRAPKCAGAPTV